MLTHPFIIWSLQPEVPVSSCTDMNRLVPEFRHTSKHCYMSVNAQMILLLHVREGRHGGLGECMRGSNQCCAGAGGRGGVAGGTSQPGAALCAVLGVAAVHLAGVQRGPGALALQGAPRRFPRMVPPAAQPRAPPPGGLCRTPPARRRLPHSPLPAGVLLPLLTSDALPRHIPCAFQVQRCEPRTPGPGNGATGAWSTKGRDGSGS